MNFQPDKLTLLLVCSATKTETQIGNLYIYIYIDTPKVLMFKSRNETECFLFLGTYVKIKERN